MTRDLAKTLTFAAVHFTVSFSVAYLLTGQVDLISAPPPREFNRLKTMPGITCA